ncbi:hypothetical protein LWI28_018333 [Acer negundo]|uniref:DYW domain-containing protein n=1 Tax=Acer negundo TaxID=4023 RepID=A0AAD5IA17_ACENE|nr:hypothetical protein LWI28_018333 [Acer negundo]
MRWTCEYLMHPHLLSPSNLTRNLINTYKFAFLHIQHSSLVNGDSTYESKMKTLHANLIKNGSLLHNLQVGNRLLNLCVESLNFGYAQKLFDEMLYRDVRTWTIQLSGFARVGSFSSALDCFRRMQNECVWPNNFTLSSVLKCCSSLYELRIGKSVHGWIVTSGIGLDVALENSILDLYVKCEAFDYAKKLFELMEDRDNVSWNIMVGAYLHIGEVEKSLCLFERLPEKGVASWNTIIDGLMKNGFQGIALELLYRMIISGHVFNKVTFSIALNLASSLSNVELGRWIHACVLTFGVQDDRFIRNSLIDMYCKCGEMEKASVLFQKVSRDFVRTRNSKTSCEAEIVSWSSMISGYVRNGEYDDAFKTFRSMVCEQVGMSKFTLTSIVSACANAGILELGRQMHAYIMKVGHKIDAHLSSSLIDMYAKCGSLDDAWNIFNQTDSLNVVQWTSMISGCALHGQGREAVKLFEHMMKKGVRPNEVTFIGVLTACSHAGLLEDGCDYFKLMKGHDLKPGFEHFACMVDLYGRAGRLNEAKEFIYNNSLSHLSAVWRSLLSSCRLHKDFAMAKWVSEKLPQHEPCDAGPYILLSNMLATEHKWEESAKVRSLMQLRGVKKHPGQSWIQLKNLVHTFVAGDRSHPQDTEIYSYLERLIGRLKEIGYSSDVQMVIQDVEEEQGEVFLSLHSEKLALVYGIISTPCGTPIQIMKNLRVCTDCHNFIKCTSKLLDREIIVRDIRRFHHFKHGRCSCGDYW